jgi:hypothetical protein
VYLFFEKTFWHRLTIKVLQSHIFRVGGNGRLLDLGEEGEELLGRGRVQLLRVGDVEDDDELAPVEGVLVDGHALVGHHLDLGLLDHLPRLGHNANGSAKK